jgi:predicted acylesterase/phospholipase RssA
LIDGGMASTAIPPYFPPWECGEKRYIDGGVYAKLPVRTAIERGADQIIALDVSYAMGSPETAHGILGISGYALSLMVEAQTAAELARAKTMGVSLRVLRLRAPLEVPFWDYSKADLLIQKGREMARQSLAEKPVSFPPAWYQRIRSGLAGLRLPRP